MRKIETGVSRQGCLSGVSGCVFAVWGFVLNAYISGDLVRTHHDFPILPTPKTLSTYLMIRNLMFLSSMLGLLLGFVTGYVLISKEFVVALRFGWCFLFVITTLFFGSAFIDWRTNFDTYGFSFLWALSLIAVGYILRSWQKNDAV